MSEHEIEMSTPDHSLTDGTLTRALGEELRRARQQVGWSRQQLAGRLHTEVQSRTLATYEHGTRQCTVVRMVEICHALAVPAPELLMLAVRRAHIDAYSSATTVNLTAVLADDREHTAPLRQWAAQRLPRHTNGDDVAHLGRGAVQEMAVLLNYRQADLIGLLGEFSPTRPDDIP